MNDEQKQILVNRVEVTITELNKLLLQASKAGFNILLEIKKDHNLRDKFHLPYDIPQIKSNIYEWTKR